MFPFSIVVPNGPVSYEGQLFRLSWAIRADADLSWKSDPSTTREITIAGGSGNDASSDLEQARSRDMDNNIRVDSGARLPWGVVVAIGVLLLGFGFAGFAIIQWFVQPGYTEELILAIVLGCLGAVLGVVPLTGLIAYYRQREQAKNIGTVSYELSADRVAPGDEVECKVAFTPTQRSIIVGPIVATVHAQETVSARRHDEHWSEAKTVHETVLTLTEIQRAERGVPFVAVGTFRIPEDAPRTIHADHHRLAWEVRIDGKIAEGGALLARRGLLVG